jgi:Zn-finger nucleic acid-binding protein
LTRTIGARKGRGFCVLSHTYVYGGTKDKRGVTRMCCPKCRDLCLDPRALDKRTERSAVQVNGAIGAPVRVQERNREHGSQQGSKECDCGHKVYGIGAQGSQEQRPSFGANCSTGDDPLGLSGRTATLRP